MSTLFITAMMLVQAGCVLGSSGAAEGCTFDVPYDLIRNPSPKVIPLLFDVHIHVITLREVANAGGSFGVDVG